MWGSPWERGAFGGKDEDVSFILHHSNPKEDFPVAFKTKCFATGFEPGLTQILLFAR